MAEDPWERQIPQAYKPGVVILASVTGVAADAVTVELEPGLTGRIDSTAFDFRVSCGQSVEVRVEGVDACTRTIALRCIRPM